MSFNAIHENFEIYRIKMQIKFNNTAVLLLLLVHTDQVLLDFSLTVKAAT